MLVGIISDVHEDIVRLQKTLDAMHRRGVEEIVCLGDIVGYSVPFYSYLTSRDANKVVELIRRHCRHVVAGNHDLYATKRVPDHRSFFSYPTDWYDREFQERVRQCCGRVFLYEDNELPSLLTKSNEIYLKSLPEFIVMEFEDHRVLLSHYAFPDPTGSSTAVMESPCQLNQQFERMRDLGCIYGFSGNDHFNGVRLFTQTARCDYSFTTFKMPNELVWLHGPTISRGTTDNGFWIYDSDGRTAEVIALGSERHVIPTSI